MTVRVATVLSARDWEADLVASARESAAVRIVTRAFRAEDIDRCVDDIEVVVAGGEVSWVTSACIAGWRRAGLAVIGVAPVGDAPAARLLEAGGADEVVPDSIDTMALIQAIRFAAPAHPSTTDPERSVGGITAVVGARGAPGATEVAIAYALASAKRRRTVLMDLDLEAPSIAVRLGLAPQPDIVAVADAVRSSGEFGSRNTQHVGRLDVVVGSHRVGEPPPRTPLVEGALRAARGGWDEVVIDLGSSEQARTHLAGADDAILVVDASTLGIVRGAQLVAGWMGPAPALVLNRIAPSTRTQIIDAARRWLGLEPAVVLADRRGVKRAAEHSSQPDRRFSRAVGSLGSLR